MCTISSGEKSCSGSQASQKLGIFIMLKKRIIPVVQLMNDSVVKTVRFNNPRRVGDATATVNVFSSRRSDELILLDIGASKRDSQPNYDLIERAAKRCEMPLSIGGGILSFDIARRIFDCGADKIVAGSIIEENPEEIERIAGSYGSQSVVAALDVALVDGQYVTLSRSSRLSSLCLAGAVERANQIGVGEIFLTSIHREGCMTGLDLFALKEIISLTKLPIVLNGGAGSLQDFKLAFEGGASGVAASSIFFWKGITIKQIKDFLFTHGFPVTVFQES